MIKCVTVTIKDALTEVGINIGSSLPYVIEVKNSDNERIFRVLSEKKDCYFTVANNDCSCNKEMPCIHQQVVNEFSAHLEEESREQEYIEHLIKERKAVEKEYEDLFYSVDVLDLDVEEIIRAEKCALREMEMDEYLDMEESMTFTDKMSFLRWNTCLTPRNRSNDFDYNQE